MKTHYSLRLILVLMMMSCGSNNNVSVKSKEKESSGKMINADDNTITSVVENPQSFESIFSVHDLFKNQNSDVVNTIAQEDFELAIKKIKYYWPDNDSLLTETQMANLRFMHIYAMAGLVIQKKKKHSDLKIVLEMYKSEFIISKFLEITQGNKMPFNQVQVEQKKEDTIKIVCANNNRFNIHCIVYTGLLEKFNLTKHVGNQAYLCGRLVEYHLSHEDVNSWISELELSEGFVKILEDEFEKE